jgi:diacylglycerol kinase (ATP)
MNRHSADTPDLQVRNVPSGSGPAAHPVVERQLDEIKNQLAIVKHERAACLARWCFSETVAVLPRRRRGISADISYPDGTRNSDDRRMTRAFVIGRLRKDREIRSVVDEVQRELEAAHWIVDTKLVTRKRDLTRKAKRAAKARCDVVVVVGGDGAVLRVAPALARTKVALGIIPTGTGNLLATNLGIPKKSQEAARTIVSGRQRQIDLGRVAVDGRTYDFSVACGVGFDADVMDKTSPAQKLRWGKIAYLANAASEIRGIANVPYEITLDGDAITTEAAQVFIANFGWMLAGMAPRRAILPDDGLLDVIVVRASGPVRGLLGGWEALRQKDLGESPDGHVFRAQAKEVRIDTTPSRLVEVDGTVVGRTPIVVSVMPSALTVIVPADYGAAKQGTTPIEN